MASTLELLLLARMAGTPVARAYASAAQTGITTPVQLNLPNVSFDNLGGFSATGLYTVAVAGTYRCYGKAKLNNTASTWVHLLLYKNGTQVAIGPEITASTTTNYGIEVEDLVQCQVGDTLALYMQSQASINTSIPDPATGVDVYFNVQLEAWA